MSPLIPLALAAAGIAVWFHWIEPRLRARIEADNTRMIRAIEQWMEQGL